MRLTMHPVESSQLNLMPYHIALLYIVFANCARFTARVQTDSVFIIEVWNITHQRAVKVANYLANNLQFALMLQRVAPLSPLWQPLATSIRPKAIWLPHMRKRKSMESEREREGKLRRTRVDSRLATSRLKSSHVRASQCPHKIGASIDPTETERPYSSTRWSSL